MIFDIRYHWLTLAAVFAALGLGVLVGVGLVQGGYVAQEQDRLLAHLEAQLIALRDENRRLHQESRALEEEMALLRRAAEMLASAAIRGRLQGREYVVLHDGSPAGQRLQALLTNAGARVREMKYEQREAQAGEELSARLIVVNPPADWPLEPLQPAAVVWEKPAGDRAARKGMERGAAGEGGRLHLVADSGVVSQWLLVEALNQGWKGRFDAVSLASLPALLEPLLKAPPEPLAEGIGP